MSKTVLWLYHILRLALALLFIYSGVTKLLNIPDFAYIIYEYHLVGNDYIYATAWSLASLEAVAGLALLVDMRGSLAVITAMLVMFVLVLQYGILKGLEVDCGCFGPEEIALHDSLRMALYRDLAMLAGIAFLYVTRWKRNDIKLMPTPFAFFRRSSAAASNPL